MKPYQLAAGLAKGSNDLQGDVATLALDDESLGILSATRGLRVDRFRAPAAPNPIDAALIGNCSDEGAEVPYGSAFWPSYRLTQFDHDLLNNIITIHRGEIDAPEPRHAASEHLRPGNRLSLPTHEGTHETIVRSGVPVDVQFP